jgi:hypothetical protein
MANFNGAVADKDRAIRLQILQELKVLDITDLSDIWKIIPFVKRRLAQNESISEATFNGFLDSQG